MVFFFELVTWPQIGHLIKGSCNVMGGSIDYFGTHRSSVSGDVFNVSHDLTRPHD